MEKESFSMKYVFMAVLFSVCLIASNLFETKIFAAGSLTLTGGLLVFPISYILNDLLTEVYGYKKARYAINLAFAMNLFVVLVAQIVRILPPEEFWDGQESFDFIFKADLRITVASMTAFLVGSLLNSHVMDIMHRKHADHSRFGVRAIVSSLVGETADSIVFFPIAFWTVGFRTMLLMMVTQIILKTLYEVIVLPITAACVRKLRANP